VEAAEAEVEEDRGDEREGSKEEEQAEEAAGREDAAEAGEEGGGRRGPLGGGEKGERRRLPPETEEPSHALFSLSPPLVLTVFLFFLKNNPGKRAGPS
jgi:hypothetical protein